MLHDLQISQLRTLLAVVEEGSFAAAAERVGRTQSAITQQMQKLELTVGKPLFKAHGRNRKPTSAGLTLARYSREILSMSRHALTAVNHIADGGLLRVGVPAELADTLLPIAAAEFNKLWPDIRLMLHVDRSPHLQTMFNENRLEVIVSTRRQSNHEGAPVHSLQSAWIASADFDWDRSNPLPIVLTDEPSLFRRIALAALDLDSTPYVEKATSPSLSGVKAAVYAGLGVTVRPKISFPGDVKVLGEKDGLPPLQRVLYYGYVTSSAAHQPARDFLDAVKNADND